MPNAIGTLCSFCLHEFIVLWRRIDSVGETRADLFSIARNALTNAFLHARPSRAVRQREVLHAGRRGERQQDRDGAKHPVPHPGEAEDRDQAGVGGMGRAQRARGRRRGGREPLAWDGNRVDQNWQN